VSDNVESVSAVEHDHEQGEVLTKVDGAEWKITNRMVDVDTDEALYRLREVEPGLFQETEIMTESRLKRAYRTDEVEA